VNFPTKISVWRELAIILACVASACAQSSSSSAKVVEEGIAVEFGTETASSSSPARSGDDVHFRFRVSDTAGTPLQGLHPAAWLDLRRSARPTDVGNCTRKVANFLGDSLLSVPAVDLNAWYVLAMNEDASISVVNPRFGFGGSQLLSMVFLDSPAEDWALTEDQQQLFVSMPDSGKVAVVDAASWKIVARLDLPSHPDRVALQPDEKYVWVSYAAGVAAFERQSLKPVAQIVTGKGPHELAFSSDSRFLFVSNGEAGTVSVIDTTLGRKVAETRTSGHPSSVTFSELARTAYIANEDDGSIVVVNVHGDLVSRVAVDPGVRQVRATPDGRFLLAVNPEKDRLYVVDSSSNRLVQDAVIHGGPDQVTFSSTLAYVRRRSDATVLMIPLDRIGIPDAPLPLVDFTGGQLPFSKGSRSSRADSIVRVPSSNAVLVANPADRAVYYYQEGMAAPMGQFQNYGHEPRAVMAVDRGLEEGPLGVYQTVGRIPQAGVYDVVFFLDSPRVVHCFEFEAGAAPGGPPPRRAILIRSAHANTLRPGEAAHVRFQVLDAVTHQPIVNLRDLRALIFLQPGIWQVRQAATEAEPGVYEIEFTPPSSGVYQAYFEASSLGLRFNSPHVLTWIATDTTKIIGAPHHE
jgi:DNA-binding beta-propeller fold protein YncE